MCCGRAAKLKAPYAGGSRITDFRESALMLRDLNPSVNSPELLDEDEDYYWEGEAMVFTTRYLLLRGYCCENGCRHCPYGGRKLPNDQPG
jgi:hypothetical protein